MNAQEIIEGNKLIAEFMGIKLPTAYDLNLSYHSSWGWLMPVVEKIEDRGNFITIVKTRCRIASICFTKGESKMESVWLAVVTFIKWYNENKS